MENPAQETKLKKVQNYLKKHQIPQKFFFGVISFVIGVYAYPKYYNGACETKTKVVLKITILKNSLPVNDLEIQVPGYKPIKTDSKGNITIPNFVTKKPYWDILNCPTCENYTPVIAKYIQNLKGKDTVITVYSNIPNSTFKDTIRQPFEISI